MVYLRRDGDSQVNAKRNCKSDMSLCLASLLPALCRSIGPEIALAFLDCESEPSGPHWP
jgi:hypothetical protein